MENFNNFFLEFALYFMYIKNTVSQVEVASFCWSINLSKVITIFYRLLYYFSQYAATEEAERKRSFDIAKLSQKILC